MKLPSIVDLVGQTPLLVLKRIGHDSGAQILCKAEFFNPLSSVKDRIGKAMVEDAEARGVLKPGVTVIEPTSGNTGIALAYICAARGYKLMLTMPDTMSLERRSLLKALGAELVLTPGGLGMQGSVEKAQELSAEIAESIILQQFENPANPRIHEETTGPEIWNATAGEVHAIVTGVGTGGTITGISRYFKARNPEFKAIAIEPEGSAVLSGGEPGPHRIQGIGAGFVPTNLDRDVIDEVITVSDDEAMEMTRRLAAEEGIFVGISAGANVCGALKVASRNEYRGKNVVTLLCDSGERYLSTPLFRDH